MKIVYCKINDNTNTLGLFIFKVEGIHRWRALSQKKKEEKYATAFPYVNCFF